jgi:hypothetical protein
MVFLVVIFLNEETISFDEVLYKVLLNSAEVDKTILAFLKFLKFILNKNINKKDTTFILLEIYPFISYTSYNKIITSSLFDVNQNTTKNNNYNHYLF